MKLFKFIFIAFMFIFLTQCSTQNKDADFLKLADEYVDGFLEWRPQYGVYLGLHNYDGKINDFSKASIQAEISRLKEYQNKFTDFNSASLSSKTYFDWKMICSNIQSELFQLEDLKTFSTNPMTYSNSFDLNIYVKRNFAPIEQQVKSIIAIEEKIPAIFENAKLNLQDSLALPHIELAIDIAKGNASFYKPIY